MRALIQISSHAKSAAGELFGNQQIAGIRSVAESLRNRGDYGQRRGGTKRSTARPAVRHKLNEKRRAQ
jgi:hypothetical protein